MSTDDWIAYGTLFFLLVSILASTWSVLESIRFAREIRALNVRMDRVEAKLAACNQITLD